MLSYTTLGSRENPHLFFFHGFLGTKEDFLPMMKDLSSDFFCVSIDLPGHGDSPWKEDIFSSLIQTVRSFSSEAHFFIGYSLGGRILLHLKEKYPSLFPYAAILSSHPGLSIQKRKTERKQEEEKWIEKLRSSKIEDFVDAWYQAPLFASFRKSPHFSTTLERRYKQNPLFLIKMLEKMSLAKQTFPSRKTLSSSYFLFGDEDTKYASLYSTLPSYVRVESLSHTGHALHLERPSECAEKIKTWIFEVTLCKQLTGHLLETIKI